MNDGGAPQRVMSEEESGDEVEGEAEASDPSDEEEESPDMVGD